MSPRLLILEDEPMILMDLTFAAEDQGFTVLSARNCDEAIQLIETHQISAGILDVNLGSQETCEKVARRLKDIEVPFFLHTGDLDRHGELLERLGARVIAKPAPSDFIAREAAKLIDA